MMTSIPFLLPLFLTWSNILAQAADNTVEVYFVVEPQVVKNYQNLGYDKQTAIKTVKGDINFMIHQVNQYFNSMEQFGLDIDIHAKKIDVLDELETPMFEDCKLIDGTKLQADLALELFQKWLDGKKMYSKISYDLALVWTGYDLFSNSGSKTTTGYATKQGVCSPTDAVGIVEFDGTQATALNTAHQIAHSLGSGHNQAKTCPSNGEFVMADSSKSASYLQWQFSLCSADDVKNNIQDLENAGNNCLDRSHTTTSASTFNINSQFGRDIMDPQKVCQRKKMNKNSYFCAYTYMYKGKAVQGDIVCQYLYCGEKGSSTCSKAMSTDGMTCDVGKRCDKGKCVDAPSSFPTSKNVIKDCVFGDIQSGDVYGSSTCKEYLDRKGRAACYGLNMQGLCCGSCAALKTGLSDCVYGDRSTTCSSYQPVEICGSSAYACCYTCRNYSGKRAVDRASQSAAGVIIEPDKELLTGMPQLIEDDIDTEGKFKENVS